MTSCDNFSGIIDTLYTNKDRILHFTFSSFNEYLSFRSQLYRAKSKEDTLNIGLGFLVEEEVASMAIRLLKKEKTEVVCSVQFLAKKPKKTFTFTILELKTEAGK